jgi:hypothetical protein
MSNIKECIHYVLDSEFKHLTQDDIEFKTQIQDINWIKKNIATINHIYMRTRSAEEELNGS